MSPQQKRRTLSSMVSNLVRRIPSMIRASLSPAWSTSARLNFTSWSTASFPTSASPTKRTRSGVFTLINWGGGGGGAGSECMCVYESFVAPSTSEYKQTAQFWVHGYIQCYVYRTIACCCYGDRAHTFASDLMSGSLSCMRPAVSTSTTS